VALRFRRFRSVVFDVVVDHLVGKLVPPDDDGSEHEEGRAAPPRGRTPLVWARDGHPSLGVGAKRPTFSS
jgi:hypothetical protein